MSEENYRISGPDSHIIPRGETDNQAPSRPHELTPREWMRNRRPNLFSDTRIENIPQLPKSVFEYHLDTLTSRKQEYPFEHFCRKLAEREICPNLRLQTGPTGGGDSKVDSETYPVAEEIAERWWIGTPSAGRERWAFAFSAKEDWTSKVKADVKSILSTDRDYKRIYFFTNQFARDRKRAELEDSLAKEAGTPVHIMDRTWIVEKVYSAELQQQETYFASLGIDNVSREKRSQPGPRDTARLEELEKLDQQVEDPSRYQGARYQLVEDCLRSALLARGLEHPRMEVEGRFTQADRLAQDLNHNQQRLRIAYNRAWTAFWWYEDLDEFYHRYIEVERRAADSNQASDIDLLYNLWMLLLPLWDKKQIGIEDEEFESRSQRLVAILEDIASDSTRPNNALQANTNLILIRIMRALHLGNLDEVEVGWSELSEVVDESEGLGTYPVGHLFDLIKELGEIIDSHSFDALYEKVADAMSERRSEGEAGMAYVRRANQKMRLEKHYEAIQWFGRAEELLIKKEYQRELVMTLLGISHAFERVGLLWAARNKALAASDLAFGVFKDQGQLIPAVLITLKWLVWLELRLGRIPHVLEAMTFADLVASQLDLPEDRLEAYLEERQMQEWLLFIHFLNLPVESLSSVTRLPVTLQQLELDYARIALLFALGHIQILYEEGFFEEDVEITAVQEFFARWQDHPSADDLPTQPILVDKENSTLRSTILGTEIVFETNNNEISFGIAESLLSTLEAFLSTCVDRDAFPYRERVTIFVAPSANLTGTPQIRFPENGNSSIRVTHPIDMHFETLAERQNFMEWLQESLLQIACRMLMIQDVEAWVEQVINQERGFSRALKFGDNLTLNRSVLGEVPKIRLTDWVDQDDQNYAVLRDGLWRAENSNKKEAPTEPLKFGSGPPPADMLDRERLKHTDLHVLTPIDVPLWDRAQWQGTVFEWTPMPGFPPILAIGFEDEEAGKEIFRAWKDRWGNVDEDNMIRVVIITGLSERKPADYAVAIGPNLCHMAETGKKAFWVVPRINRMTPTSSVNLDNFVAAYRETGGFFLAPVLMSTSRGVIGETVRELAIAKRELDIREAWQVGENDPDRVALLEDDDPIIPAGVTDPPVNKALASIRTMRGRRQ